MTASQLSHVVCSTAEPHRRNIGTGGLVIGISMMVLMAVVVSSEHRQAVEAKQAAASHLDDAAIVEDAIRDMISLSNRPLIIYTMEPEGDGRVVVWPERAKAMLGWDLKDVRAGGIEILMPKSLREDHRDYVRKALDKPLAERKTTVLHCDAISKSGEVVPVRITTWAVGDSTRSVAAVIEPESMVVERRIVRVK